MSSNCPQCGSGSISVTETKTSVTHRCNKCGYSETQAKRAVGRFYAAAFLAVFALAVVLTIWAGGAA